MRSSARSCGRTGVASPVKIQRMKKDISAPSAEADPASSERPVSDGEGLYLSRVARIVSMQGTKLRQTGPYVDAEVLQSIEIQIHD